MFKKIFLLIIGSILIPLNAQEERFDNTILCMNTNSYLKDNYIKFNNNSSKAWVMDLENFVDDTWEERKLSSQPDRWVIDTLSMSNSLKFQIIINKDREEVSLEVFKMSSISSEGLTESNTNSMICVSEENEYMDILLKNKEIRQKFKSKFIEDFSKALDKNQ
ncbi:MAG: hypothetical protein O3A49_05170 [Candidatus Marinimicrobia bacterium]|nr:hypothetical protein [Candidatus Neomarinimicrobiota bacterium]